MARLLCWLGLHKWSKWGQMFSFDLDDYQRRFCERCHKTAQRRVGVSRG
jgi:hypothetical protein